MTPKKFCAALLILAQAAAGLHIALAENATIELPDIGDPTGTLMTPQQESELGWAFFRSLHSKMEINEDPEALDYIQTVGEKLTGNSDDPARHYTFFVVNSAVINAFAGPGGYIGVNSGLITLTDEESELASVMAHEIAHVTQKHMFQTFQAASRLSIPTALAMLAGALLGSHAGWQAGMAAMMAAQAAATQYQINFTRDNEAEADRVGMQILSKSEFDPRAMPNFFEKMQQSTRFAGSRLPEFLLTHPVTVSRISDTRDRSEQFGYRQYPDTMAYRIIKAKLRVQTAGKDPKAALEYFRAVNGQGTKAQQDATLYGMALALQRLGRFDEARPMLQRLALAYPNQSQFVSALGALEMDAHNYAKAVRINEQALQRFPGNRALTFNQSRALLQAGEAQEARKLLHDYLRYHQPTPDVYEVLAETYSKLGSEAEYHRYYAEAYYADGQTRAGIQQMQIAKKFAGDNFYLNSVIDQRISEWTQEERARKEDR